MYASGLRVSEVISVKIGEIDLKQKTIKVNMIWKPTRKVQTRLTNVTRMLWMLYQEEVVVPVVLQKKTSRLLR